MHVYFSAIGGVGIGPLAMLSLDAEYSVSGSDLQESEMTKQLQERGVNVYIGQDGSQVAEAHKKLPIDWLVYSSAIPDDHPELLFAKQNGIKTSKRDEFINNFMTEHKLQLVAVAGTHGKTSVTSMIVWLCKQFNVPVSYSIGTTVSFGPAAQYEYSAKYFIYECDEFDRNFLQFKPAISAITSMDYDHPDTYPTQADYTAAFKAFTEQSQSLFTWQKVARALGISPTDTHTILNETDPVVSGIGLAGTHTRRNALLAAHVAQKILPKTTVELLAGVMKAYPGSNRRFEKLAENLYTDYAHHPVEIAATIQMAKELNRNVVVVYQPHQNVRQHEIIRENAYAHCFDGVEKLYWLPTYLSREQKDLPILSPTELIVSINPDIKAEYDEMNETLWQKIKAHYKSGDLVLAMSAGDLDIWLREKVREEA